MKRITLEFIDLDSDQQHFESEVQGAIHGKALAGIIWGLRQQLFSINDQCEEDSAMEHITQRLLNFVNDELDENGININNIWY